MTTKAELEEENASLQRKIKRLERKLASIPKVDEEPIQEVLESPSPVDRGQMYVESHPILGVLSTAHVARQSTGDGRLGGSAEFVREKNG